MKKTPTSAGKNNVPDVYIVGLGIMNIKQITLEVRDAIQCSQHVFFVDNGFGVEEYLQSLCPQTTNLSTCYKYGESRRIAYNEMASLVLAGALEKQPVCFAAYGHPSIFVYPTFLIKNIAPLLGLNVKIYPGISAFDTALVDLGLDPGFHGFQMYDATDLVARKRPLQNDVPCLLWQVDVTGIVEYSDRSDLVYNLQRLEAHLSKFYPMNHPITLIHSSSFPLLDAIKHTFPLNELAASARSFNWGGTLYIPPAEIAKVKDEKFVDLMHRKSKKGGYDDRL